LSPFQFPISINFRGTQFSLTTTSTKVKLPDGQVISILPESIPQIIEL
jgi:hypothetical protein